MREVAPSERAEIAFRKGVTQIQEGRANAAELEFRDALKQDPTHLGALQAILGLLVDSGRNNEAEQFLHKALDINPRQPRHAMVLARLEVERGEVTGAINTMVAALPYVQSDFDFYAFLAALLQREGRHREAVDYYRTALRGVPGNGVWMMGMGISLRASNQSAEARDAFVHALESKQLSPALQEFVERQLRELAATKKK
jgi:MSHA biogenesis protein MshN